MSDRRKANLLRLLLMGTGFVVLFLDRLTKGWIQTNIPLGSSLPESGFFRLTNVQNTGAAWGTFQDSTTLLAIFSGVAAVGILTLGMMMPRRIPLLQHTPTILALGLILGGTLGNFIDRAFVGFVTDFIKMGSFPDYNIADSGVVVGSVLLAYTLLRYGNDTYTCE